MDDLGSGPEVFQQLGGIVLAGGTAARMDGVDKASLEVAGVTLLERALAATVNALEVVVVGDQVPTSRPVTWTVEDPRGGGPAAGLLTALDRFLRPPELVAVLAVDMPRVTPATFARLVGALAAATRGPTAGSGAAPPDGAVLLGPDGRRQWLCAVYRRDALERARPAAREDEHGLALHRLVGGLPLVEVPSVAAEADDVDTWEDLCRLRLEHEEGTVPRS